MQLFFTNAEIDGDTAIIREPRVINQLSKVLRASKGYVFEVQFFAQDKTIRNKVSIITINKEYVTCEIIQTTCKKSNSENFGMIICMPNSRDKLELIAQKLSEIGLEQIILRPSNRSLLNDLKPNKKERLEKIITEACEQSKSRNLTKIIFLKDIRAFLEGKNLIVFNFDGENDIKIEDIKNLYGIIGPEGGFATQDMEILEKNIYKKINLGENTLRMETGAIIGARMIKNSVHKE